MNKQTNELLAILLNAPGQHFTYDALAEYLHVSTRTIRNYVQALRDFLQSRDKEELLTISDKGLSVSGTSAEL